MTMGRWPMRDNGTETNSMGGERSTMIPPNPLKAISTTRISVIQKCTGCSMKV